MIQSQQSVTTYTQTDGSPDNKWVVHRLNNT